MKHVLSVKVNNSAGVLSHVAGLFTRRSYNIDSLCVGETHDPRFSVITLVIDEDAAMVEQITKQLLKLIDVIEIRNLTGEISVKRELLLIAIEIGKDERAELLMLSRLFETTVIEMSESEILLQMVAEPRRVSHFLSAIRHFRIRNMARTGVVALALPGEERTEPEQKPTKKASKRR
ncbi:MAG: acetolactate synthase small subunit [Turneriella sp.]|nr:acetolactate synthase small subunit [Turneriella sp.]